MLRVYVCKRASVCVQVRIYIHTFKQAYIQQWKRARTRTLTHIIIVISEGNVIKNEL